MSEPTFGQIPAEIGGCADSGWQTDFPNSRTVVITKEFWADWQPLKASVKADGGEWVDTELVRGEVTSDTDVCKATRVTLRVVAERKFVLRTYAEDGSVGTTEWFRYLRFRRRKRARAAR